MFSISAYVALDQIEIPAYRQSYDDLAVAADSSVSLAWQLDKAREWAIGAVALKPATIAGSGEPQAYYYHNDHLGTPKVITDESQAVVWQADGTPFGSVLETVSTVDNPLRFPGQYFDAETGLHYNYFRDYDPGIGRYTQSDPIGLAGGLNPYLYVGGNPKNFFDSLGLFPTCDSVILGVFDVISSRTEERVLSRDYGFSFVVTRPSVSPNLDPRRLRQPPIKPSLRTEVWWALKEMLSVKKFEIKKTFQNLKVFCTEQLMDECGNIREFNTSFERTELISEIERLTGKSIETREELIRLLFVIGL